VVSGERSLLGWRKPGVSRLAGGLVGAGLMDEFISAVESRSIWSRFGL
jgi:hypothetical protein